MPHLMSVDKVTFLFLREGVTSPMRANDVVEILRVKSLKFRSFRGLRLLGPHQGQLKNLGAVYSILTLFSFTISRLLGRL